MGVAENGRMLKKLFQISIRLQLRDSEAKQKIQHRDLVRERERARTDHFSQRFNGVKERMIWNTRSCTERFNVVRERERERENNLRYYRREIQWCKRENNPNKACFKAGYWKPHRYWVWEKERERRIKAQMQFRIQSIRESSILKESRDSRESRDLSFHNPRN